MQAFRSHHDTIDPAFLLNAYRHSFFPMADSKTGRIGWYSPDPRAILDLSEFRIPRSLRQTIRKKLFDVRVNIAFERVMRHCAERAETWISEGIIRSYCKLHELGYAHSVESWSEQGLAGGLYGVALGGAFFGESMFSKQRDASKVALAFLVERLRERKFLLLDLQFLTPHLARFGGKEIPRSEYLRKLSEALGHGCTFVEKT